MNKPDVGNLYMNNLKIGIIGNSVALRNRPPRDAPHNRNYTKYLEELLADQFLDTVILIQNMAFGAATLMDAHLHLDEYIQSLPDYFVINLGVVDSSTREIPLWYYKFINSRKDSWLVRINAQFHKHLIKRMRPALVRLWGRHPWTSSGKFRKLYTELIHTLHKETNAKIITLPINPANKRVEQQLPGSHANHLKYNRIIQEISDELDLYYIDLSDLNSQTHYPDGVHFSLEGHKIVARRLHDIIAEDYRARLKTVEML